MVVCVCLCVQAGLSSTTSWGFLLVSGPEVRGQMGTRRGEGRGVPGSPRSPELSRRWEPRLLPPLSFPPLVEAANLVGICCCTAACLWIWLVALSSWMGTSLLAGRLSAGALSLRATSGRSAYSDPALDTSELGRGPGALVRVMDPSSPFPLKLGAWLRGGV